VMAEIADMAGACRARGVISKVILETCYLTDGEARVCPHGVRGGDRFRQDLDGIRSGGATASDVRLMREAVGPKVGVKAAGGVRRWRTRWP
jgi:deoxyribose-phosphate aldolase